MYVYFQFVSEEKETHQEAKCLIQDHPGEGRGALSQCLLSFHNPHVSTCGESARDKATLPMLPGTPLKDGACGNSLETLFWTTEDRQLPMPPTSYLT